jgi:hypothetical protein
LFILRSVQVLLRQRKTLQEEVIKPRQSWRDLGHATDLCDGSSRANLEGNGKGDSIMSASKKAVLSFGVAAGLALSFGAMFATTEPAVAGQIQLITPAEAQLPPLKGAVASASRGITRGPRIELVDAVTDGAIHSPMHLQLKFQAFGGAQVDPNAVSVTYLRSPEVDLTSRVRPFVQASGIDIPETVLPPGDHVIRVDVKDSDGRTGTTSFTLKVAP